MIVVALPIYMLYEVSIRLCGSETRREDLAETKTTDIQ